MGAATAWRLAAAGRRVLQVEQFELGHLRGSSHGGSRVIRVTHPEVDYASLMPGIFGLWRDLERASGESLLRMTGGVFVGPPADPWLAEASAALTSLGHPFRLQPCTVAGQPQLRFPAGWQALEQPDSGIVDASRAVAAMTAQARRLGAEVRAQTRVEDITPEVDGVRVRLAGRDGATEVVHATQVVITAGPWAGRLLSTLPAFAGCPPLAVTRQQVAYFPVRDAGLWGADAPPLFIVAAEPLFYGFPVHERPGEIKVALELTGDAIDPDAERTVDAEALARLCALVDAHLVGIDPTPTQVEPCLYTQTPTSDFVVDRHPEHPQVLFAAGFSGRGFKFAPGIGQLLCDLAAGAPGAHDSVYWRPRFALRRAV
jgi:sarcosine oxidase